ncbi:MAG: hypothetical protein ACLU4P_13045 [Ruminococcus sp.]
MATDCTDALKKKNIKYEYTEIDGYSLIFLLRGLKSMWHIITKIG